ncbi:MAG: EAL domain-containing protein [Sedimenticola sp.]
MADLQRMDKAELIRLLKLNQELLATNERDEKQQLHDLQTHQIELELQNRDLREAQQALEEARDRYADLYDFAPVGYLTLDQKGIILESNLTAAILLGRDRTQLTGKPLVTLLERGESTMLFHHLREALTNTGTFVTWLKFPGADGLRILRLESKADVEPGHCRTALLDVTEQRLADRRRRLTEQVFDYALEGIMVTGPDQTIEWVNPAFETTTGYSAREAVGQTPVLLHSGHHDSDFYRRMWSELKENGFWKGEIWNRRKDSEIYPEWLNISSIRDDAGDIEHYLGIFADISSQHHLKERLHKLAYYDGLTGLPNRGLFTDRLDRALAHARRDNQRVALLFLDLDHFKHINDSLGHRIGDDLLTAVADRLKIGVREGDTVARLGGDEFVILLPGQETSLGALEVAHKIKDLLSEVIKMGEHELLVTSSIGIALYPDDGEEGESLLQHADAAMYRAKEKGRNRCQTYSKLMSDGANRRLSLEQELRIAVRDHEFTLAYQPQVDAAEGRLLGLEALARWPREGKEPVGPDEFIPLAEETGLIEPLGQWALHTACTQAQAWYNKGLQLGSIAVNFSGHQLCREGFEQQITDTLIETGLDPKALELEITESVLMDGYPNAPSALSALNEMGIAIAMDDFGTGYSSLAYLKRLPIQRLKIDRSFIMDIPEDKDDIAITMTIIAMARHLGLEVIAEGIETEAQRDFLLQQGCRAMQGYFFSRPLPADEIEKLLLNPPNRWRTAP